MEKLLALQKEIDRLIKQIEKAQGEDKKRLTDRLADLELEREWLLL